MRKQIINIVIQANQLAQCTFHIICLVLYHCHLRHSGLVKLTLDVLRQTVQKQIRVFIFRNLRSFAKI